MNIQLTSQESESLFHTALCNGLAYIQYYDLELRYSKADYSAAKQKLKQQEPDRMVCYEDVLLQILKDGGTLTLVDLGGGDFTSSIKLEDVHTRVQLSPPNLIIAVHENQDDADTADGILQTVFFQEIIFG
jgi:hypothetical protein